MKMPDKRKYLENLSDENGFISALAIDQRGALKKMINKHQKEEATAEQIKEFKTLVSEHLTKYSSSILLDPEYGLEASKMRDKNAGLLLAYEKTGYDANAVGRLPDCLVEWSAKRLKEEGADAVKFLLYYDVDENEEINIQKKAYMERIGAECIAEDIPFFLEILSYDCNIDDNSTAEYAKVKPIRDENGVTVDFEIEGDFPKYGNDDDRVDEIAKQVLHTFIGYVKGNHTYRGGIQTTSILTITSNVSYGKNTGATPDGRKKGVAFAPGANPMHGRDRKGAVASLTSVAKLPFTYAKDGISYTFSIVPAALGKEDAVRKTNLVGLLDGYFHHEASIEGGQHLNVNVMNRDMLLDAIAHPENYPNLTIRVSGYAVRFNALTREQQQDVISRTFTQAI